MNNCTVITLDVKKSNLDKNLHIIKNLEDGIWIDGKENTKLGIMGNPHLEKVISYARSTFDRETDPELKVSQEKIYNLLVKEQTRRSTCRENKLNEMNNNNNNNNNMNEVTQVQTELNGILPEPILELTTSNAAGVGFTTAHNKLYRIIRCNLVAKVNKSSPKGRYVCLVENLDSNCFNKRFFTLQFSKALKMFNSKRSLMPDVETELGMEARWKTMKIKSDHIYALLHRSDSHQYAAMEKYVKKHNTIQFSSTEKPKIERFSPNPVEFKVKPVETAKESNSNTEHISYTNELDEENQTIVNWYFLMEESFQDAQFTTLPTEAKNAIYERLPVSRQESMFKKAVDKIKKSHKNNG